MSAATRTEISSWFDRGIENEATHMIIVCDTFDHDDYPVYVRRFEDFWKKYQLYDGQNMQRIMEVYDLKADKVQQLSESRVLRTPPRAAVQSRTSPEVKS